MMFNASRVSYASSTKSSRLEPDGSSSFAAGNSFSSSSKGSSGCFWSLDSTESFGSYTSSPTQNSTKVTLVPAGTDMSTFTNTATSETPSFTTDAISTTRSLHQGKTAVSYTRSYVITESSTTFTTQLTRVSVLNTNKAATFTAPTAAVTTDVAFYNRWLSGTLDSGQSSGSISAGHRNAIIASVLGSVGGFFIAATLIWAIVFWRRKKRVASTQGFSHEIGCRVDDPANMDNDAYAAPNRSTTNRSSDEDEEFLKSKYSSFGRKLPLWRKSDAKPKPHNSQEQSAGPEQPRAKGNPFQDEFDFQKRLPLLPPVPTRSSPLQTNFSYPSEDTSSISGTDSDSSSSIQLSRPNAVARSTQSFLREVL
ncbi:LAFA_0F14466g1_1 [Lachancea sp. 'fantastica']|nr:LAFA_0F14466g1_1 [Lachancea sp. 'fantastica']